MPGVSEVVRSLPKCINGTEFKRNKTVKNHRTKVHLVFCSIPAAMGNFVRLHFVQVN